ncbi:hypothetical protein ACFL17_00755 [Pseudomonadota bacterium]
MGNSVRMPIIGSVVLATDQGLGVLAKSFYDNGIVTRVLIEVRPSQTNHFNWYPGAKAYEPENILAFIDGLDVLLIFEKLADWTVAEIARERGVRIALMPMYEITPEYLPVEPDHYLAPSNIDLDRYRDRPSVSMITVPVDVPWQLRKKARLFIHNSGTRWSFFRNGTFELLAALPTIRSAFKLIIRMQDPFLQTNYDRHARKGDVELALKLLENAERDPRVEIVIGTESWEDLWLEGDVFVFPEQYNGLSLPLQEAYASGMLVMAANRYPINTWLPNEPLIPVSGYRWSADFGLRVKHAIVRSEQIAQNIDKWYDSDLEAYSRLGRSWARNNSWNRVRQTYLDILVHQSFTNS